MRSLRSMGWLLAINFAIVLLLGTVTHLLGIDRFFTTTTGIRWEALLGGAAIFGFGGAFLSLLISKPLAKWSTKAEVITAQASDPRHRWVYEKVRALARRAGLPMPEVAIYPSDEPNAFATGASRKSSLVAVSTGLLDRMDDREVEAVLAHELAHIENGDMVTMTLLQGVLNTFVIALARVVGVFADQFFRGDEDDGEPAGPGIAYFVTSIACQIFFGLLASMVAASFSRRRELRADAGAAGLVGAPAMIAALDGLRRASAESELPAGVASLGLRGKAGGGGILSLLSTHPSIEERIEALRTLGSATRPSIDRVSPRAFGS